MKIQGKLIMREYKGPVEKTGRTTANIKSNIKDEIVSPEKAAVCTGPLSSDL